jgi:hypothetical protein
LIAATILLLNIENNFEGRKECINDLTKRPASVYSIISGVMNEQEAQ